VINVAEPLPRRRRGRPTNVEADSRIPEAADRHYWTAYGKEVRFALRNGPLTPEVLIKKLRSQNVSNLLTRQAIAWAEIEGIAYWDNGKWWAPKRNQ